MKSPVSFIIALTLGMSSLTAGIIIEAIPQMPAQLTLEQSVKLMLQNNVTLKVVQESILEQQAVLTNVQSGQQPSLALNSTYQATDRNRMESFGSLTTNDQYWNTDLQVSYSIYSGGALTAAASAQESRLHAAQARLTAVLQGLILETHSAYFAGLLAHQQIQVQEESIRLLKEQLTIAESRYNAGSGSQFEVLRAKVSLENTRPALIRSRNEYRLAIDHLRRLMGMQENKAVSIESTVLIDTWASPTLNTDLSNAIATAKVKRPDLMIWEKEIEARKADINRANAGYKPKVGIGVAYGFQNKLYDQNFGTVEGWKGSVSLSWPIFDGQATQSAVMAARSRQRQAEFILSEQQQLIESEVRDAWYFYEVSGEILTSSDAVIGQAEEALRLANSRLSAGVITQLDVLQSQLDLTRARLEKARAQHDFNLAYVSLKKAMGTLTQ
jgi:outer membrane protein TolC